MRINLIRHCMRGYWAECRYIALAVPRIQTKEYMSDLIKKEEPVLPSLPTTILPAIAELTASLGIPREVLASAEEIEYAWRDLPRELREIPPELRGELMARMCVAVSTGLFDGAMNYAWNAAVLQLRQKIRNFGLPVVARTAQNR